MEIANNMYDGAACRDQSGRIGRVVKMTAEAVEIGWEAAGSYLPRVERISRRDERLEREVEVLTLDRGWCSMFTVVGLRESAGKFGGLIDELKSVLEPVTETKGFRYPFKRQTSIGLGPRKGRNSARKSEPWECSCKNYKCTCVSGKGKNAKTRTVRIKKAYKLRYDREYKAWARKKTGKPRQKPSGKKSSK